MNFSDTIILTGAGFTANFGGFLAREMWSKIFNNPKMNDSGNLKIELRKNFDFEDLYSQVLGNRMPKLHPQEYSLFVESLNEAYEALDDAIKNPAWDYFGINPGSLEEFLNYFKKTPEGKLGAYFTLNQDLFPERNLGWQPTGPELMQYTSPFKGNLGGRDLDSEETKILPNEEQLETFKNSFKGDFLYVKLHGSQKWVAGDGRDTKILGINKREAIERIPLLKWYFSLFEQALYRPNVKLIVIGYGFKDEHINNCIFKAVTEHRLKLYILTTEDPADFSFRMGNKYPRGGVNDQDPVKLPIWNAVDGFFPYKLRDLFPNSNRHSVQKSEFFNALGIPL